MPWKVWKLMPSGRMMLSVVSETSQPKARADWMVLAMRKFVYLKKARKPRLVAMLSASQRRLSAGVGACSMRMPYQ